jgi:hypothetical protein
MTGRVDPMLPRFGFFDDLRAIRANFRVKVKAMNKAAASAVPLSEDTDGLERRHEELERRLAVLDRHLSLTPDEQVERARLKKEKLWVKDRLLVLSERAGPRAIARDT